MMTGGVITDRKTDDKDDQADRDDGPKSVGEAVVNGQKTADGFKHQKRGGTECGIGNLKFGPFAECARGKAQGVIFQRFVGHPGIIIAADFRDALMNGKSHRE